MARYYAGPFCLLLNLLVVIKLKERKEARVSYPRIFKRLNIILAVALSFALFYGCSGRYPPEWGKRLKYKNSSLFYTPTVTKDEALKLGDYLLKAGFFPEKAPVRIQLAKSGDMYQFRLVIKEGKEQDMEFIKTTGLFAAMISRDVFGRKALEVHLCDKDFKTLQVVSFQYTDDQKKVDETHK